MVAHGWDATLVARLLFVPTYKRAGEFEPHRHALHTGLGAWQEFSLGALRGLGRGKSFRLVHSRIGGSSRFSRGALWGECRGDTFRLVHPIPRHGAPVENSRPTQPRAAHRAQISVMPSPMHCASREISPRPQARSAPREKLHPAPRILH